MGWPQIVEKRDQSESTARPMREPVLVVVVVVGQTEA
jgi:hypothetical protein